MTPAFTAWLVDHQDVWQRLLRAVAYPARDGSRVYVDLDTVPSAQRAKLVRAGIVERRAADDYRLTPDGAAWVLAQRTRCREALGSVEVPRWVVEELLSRPHYLSSEHRDVLLALVQR